VLVRITLGEDCGCSDEDDDEGYEMEDEGDVEMTTKD
jgi:hypothetical protein